MEIVINAARRGANRDRTRYLSAKRDYYCTNPSSDARMDAWLHGVKRSTGSRNHSFAPCDLECRQKILVRSGGCQLDCRHGSDPPADRVRLPMLAPTLRRPPRPGEPASPRSRLAAASIRHRVSQAPVCDSGPAGSPTSQDRIARGHGMRSSRSRFPARPHQRRSTLGNEPRKEKDRELSE
jgi:hypothetical protein